MTKISLIVAIDEQNGMGKDNQLLCHLPADLKHFKALTLGKPIIMGRKTFDSIGKPLPGRVNIVLSRQVKEIEGVLIASSLAHAFSLTNRVPEIMIIGGAGIYKQALPYAHAIYLTRIHHQFLADTFFPHLNEHEWRCEESIEHPSDDKNPYAMTFNCYKRINEPLATSLIA